VRPGLVVVGLALLAVGGVVGYAGLTLPGTGYASGLTETISAPNIAPAQLRVVEITVTNSSSGSFSLSWASPATLNVSLYQGVACPSPAHYCESGRALADWPANTSGNWRHTGTIMSPYLLAMQNPGSANVTLEGSLAESYPDGTSPAPTSTVLTVLAGGVLLVTIGGLALFLGLFLRRGVYAEPESVPPRYAHELDRPREGYIDPLDEPFDEEADATEEPGGRH
jgi:hypothetical protein